MPAPNIRHPLAHTVVPSTFAAYGSCDPGHLVAGRLVSTTSGNTFNGIVAFQGAVDWIIHFVGIPADTYDLEVTVPLMPGLLASAPITVMMMMVLPSTRADSASPRKAEVAGEINPRKPARARIRNSKPTLVKTTAKTPTGRKNAKKKPTKKPAKPAARKRGK